MGENVRRKRFADVDLQDPFFDSLKADYAEFESWFRKKSEDAEEAYVLSAGAEIKGFLYVKAEDGDVADVQPPLEAARRIKIGTFKVDAHGTRLGERLLKKAIDHAVVEKADELYVTIFPKHAGLLALLEEFGFVRTGVKRTGNGEEQVLVKRLGAITGEPRKDFPMIYSRGRRKFLLSIYPEWHTRLFADSILKNETYDILQDVSHTNSIEKTYVCFMDLSPLSPGDIVVIYRTSDQKGPAWYRSVVTSVCTVEEVRHKSSFSDSEDYVKYTEPFSVFDETDLLKWWNRGGRLYVVRMLYSAAFSKRLIRKDLVERFGLDSGAYWGFLELSDKQFAAILGAGGIDARLVVN
jgi:L-amino acid N-acyltransferase YncA